MKRIVSLFLSASFIISPVSASQTQEDFRKARCAYAADMPEAMMLLKGFAVEYPASSLVPEARLMIANIYFFARNYGEALETYNLIPDNAFAGEMREEFLYRKAFSMVKTGYYDEARPLFLSLLSSGKYGDAALFYDAYIDYVKGGYDEAYDKFSRVSHSGERGLEAAYYLNQIDFKRGDYQKVVKNSRKLLSQDSGDELLPETLRVTGLSYFKLGDKRNARNYLEQYVDAAEEPEIAALYSLATIYYDAGELGEAEALFSQLTDDRNDIAQSAWLYLGQIYARQQNDQAASIAFDKAARMAWDGNVSETASYNLSVAAAEGNSLPFADTAGVMESFMTTYPNSPHTPEISRYLASAYYNQRDYEKALETLDKANQKGADTDAMRQKMLYELGKQQLLDGYTDRALKSLQAAVGYRTDDKATTANARLWLGDALYSKGRYSEAAAQYEDAIKLRSLGANTALAQYDLGYAYMKLKNYAKAKGCFSAALKEGINTALQNDARLRLGDCLYYTGDYNGAMAEFRKVGATPGQESIYAKVRQADILALQGNVAEEIAILSQLADKGAGSWNKEVLKRLADAYSAAGQDANAAKVYSRLIDSGVSAEESSQMYFSLAANAEKLYERGEKEEAYELYKRLMDSGEAALYQDAVVGMMRTAPSPDDVELYALMVKQMPLAPDVALEAQVRLAEAYVAKGLDTRAEKMLTDIIDEGGDGGYWLARAYIALADSYTHQGKEHLAKMYLETIRDNYPGKEKDIKEMIKSRLK